MFDVETRKFHDVGNFASRKHCNRLAQRLLNDELKNVIHPEDYKKVKSVRKQAEANKEPWSGTFRILDDQADTIWVKVQATPQISESGVVTSYIFFYSQVTSQLRVQDDLRKAIEQTEKSLSAKNAFLGRLSHEIRTPMNAVVGIADALIHHLSLIHI